MIGPGDPRHGQNTGYNAGCRQECCRRAHTRYRNLHRLYGSDNALVRSLGSQRRIRALARLGWSQRQLSLRMGKSPTYLKTALESSHLRGDTARRIARIYDELCMRPAPRTSRTAWVIARAEANRWAPPLAWDGINMDDPKARPRAGRVTPRGRNEIDFVVVERVLDGHVLETTTAERHEIMRRWKADGRSEKSLCDRMGWGDNRYGKDPALAEAS